MFIQFSKSDENGKAVRAVKVLDYAGKCERPFDLPLRESLLWKSARYADLHGEFPDGEELFGNRRGRYAPAAFQQDDLFREEKFPPSQPSTVWRNNAASGEALIVQAELERVRLSCGKCHWCANERKRRWERAATGWIENSPLSLFGTLTFSDEYFSSNFNAWVDAQLERGADLAGSLGFDAEAWNSAYSAMRVDRFDSANPEHDAFMRRALMDERQKLLKRLRHALGHDVRFDGVKLNAHLAVYEYGDLRGRLHMHFLMHFDIGETPVGSAYSRLRSFLKEHWDDHGVGFVDVQHASPDEGGESAKYLLQYLLKYEEEHNRKRVTKSRSRLAVSQGYRVKGQDFYFAARPSLIPGGTLRPVDPVPPEQRGGFPASGGDADLEDLRLSEASQKLSFKEMPHEFRVLAEEIAKARLAWRDGDLWPMWSVGRDRPEDDWAEVPPDAHDFASWLLSRSWKDDRRAEPFAPDEPPWAPAQGGVAPTALVYGEVLGRPVTERAAEARGLTPDTVIHRNGSYLVHPDELLSLRRLARNPSDGTVYDVLTGETVDDV